MPLPLLHGGGRKNKRPSLGAIPPRGARKATGNQKSTADHCHAAPQRARRARKEWAGESVMKGDENYSRF